MLRLLIKDITVEKLVGQRQLVLHIRWQGGACTDITVSLPKPRPEAIRYPAETVEQVRRRRNICPIRKLSLTSIRLGFAVLTESPLRSR